MKVQCFSVCWMYYDWSIFKLSTYQYMHS